MPAVDCDLDHITPWIDSRITDADDPAPLCRHHHRIRHQTAGATGAKDTGDYKLKSHFGHTYLTSGRSP